MSRDIQQRTPEEQRALEASLLQASGRGNLVEVRRLIEEQGVNPNCTDDSRKTPLILASGKNNSDVVRYLLDLEGDNKVNIDAQDEFGKTALMWVCFYHNEDLIKLMLEKEANVNLLSFGQNALYQYVARPNVAGTNVARPNLWHDTSIIDLFKNHGLDFDLDTARPSMITKASEVGASVDFIDRIIFHMGDDMDSAMNRQTLRGAAENHDIELVELLLRYGVSRDCLYGADGAIDPDLHLEIDQANALTHLIGEIFESPNVLD